MDEIFKKEIRQKDFKNGVVSFAVSYEASV